MNNSIETDKEGLFICPICLRKFKALAYHTRQKHKLDAKSLRELFNLPLNYSLQIPELKERRRQEALKYNMDIQLKRVGQHTRFQKGIKVSKEVIEKIARGHLKHTRNSISQSLDRRQRYQLPTHKCVKTQQQKAI